MQSHEVGALARLARLGWQVEDSEEERLAKSVVTLTACLISVLSFVWVGTYLTLGLVGAAQEMLVRDPAVSSQLQVRIGIATGPVVAGVIGTRKFIYDLWGDTVNMASRMESHGLPGMIQVTEATYRRLSGKYKLRERGTVTVKGKGDMPTWILVGRTVGSASPPAATPR